MSRSLLISAVVAALVAGCVSLGPGGTALPTAPPSLSIVTSAPQTPTPALPTASPTATPTDTPTVAPTATPLATPTLTEAPTPTSSGAETPEPTLAVIEDFGADTLLFTDDFSDDTSGWGVGENPGGVVEYVNGALQFDTGADGAWMWSPRTIDTASAVMHLEAEFLPSSEGYQGLLCANSADELWGAVANAAGLWVFMKLTGAGATVLTSTQQEGFEITPGVTTLMALDCAGTDTGEFRMQLSLPDLGLAALYEGAAGEGAPSFDRAGIYAESASHPFTMRADNLAAYGGTGETGEMSAAAQALLQHVPESWRSTCFELEPSPFETGAETDISCAISGDRSDVVDYVQFDTQENMDAAYQTRVETWAVEPTSSCQSGPNETSYTIGGSPAGRILCAPQTVGARYDWTHDALLVMTTLTDFEGSYPDLYDDWLIAGPD